MLRINGVMHPLKVDQSISSLLEELGVDWVQVVIEHNGEISDRHLWKETRLQSGDRLEIVRFMGGG